SLNVLVQFLLIVPWPRSENPSTPPEYRRFNTSCTGGTGTFLLFYLPCTSRNLGTLLGFVRTLPLVCQILLNIQINGVIVRFYCEYSIRKFYLPTCFFSLYI